jgi:hypothetical protein
VAALEQIVRAMPLFEENDSMTKRHEWNRWRDFLLSKTDDLKAGQVPDGVIGVLSGDAATLRGLCSNWYAGGCTGAGGWSGLALLTGVCKAPAVPPELGLSDVGPCVAGIASILISCLVTRTYGCSIYWPLRICARSASVCMTRDQTREYCLRYEYGVAQIMYVSPWVRASNLSDLVSDWMANMNTVRAWSRF